MRKQLPTSTTLGQEAADKLRAAAAEPLETIRSTAEHLVVAVRACVERRRKIGEDYRITQDAKLTDWAEEDAKLDATIDQVDERRLEARRSLDELAADPDLAPDTVEGCILAEMKLGRAWQRVHRLLEVGQAAYEIGDQAVKDGDRQVFLALYEEWPAYARGTAVPEKEIEDTIKLLNELEAPMLTALEVAVREVRDEAAKVDSLAQQAVAWVRQDGHSADAVPGPDGQMISVATADVAAV